MTWFKVDDKLHSHRKRRAAGMEAMGLWVTAGSWCGDNLSDGFVPRDIAGTWADGVDLLAARLVEAGLWKPREKSGEKGWQFVHWSEFQPTRAKVQKERKDAAQRMRDRRARTAERSGELPANVRRSSGRDGTGNKEEEVSADVHKRPPEQSAELVEQVRRLRSVRRGIESETA